MHHFSILRAHFLHLPRRVIILSFSYCIYLNPFLLLFLPFHQQFKFNQRFKIIQPFRPKHSWIHQRTAKVERVADTYDFHVDLSILKLNRSCLELGKGVMVYVCLRYICVCVCVSPCHEPEDGERAIWMPVRYGDTHETLWIATNTAARIIWTKNESAYIHINAILPCLSFGIHPSIYRLQLPVLYSV